MGRGETRANDDEGVRREKVKGRQKKVRVVREREGANKFCFPWLQTKIIFIGDAMCDREIVFQIFFLGKQPIENKPYFYKSFPLIKDSFLLTKFFFMPPHIEK